MRLLAPMEGVADFVLRDVLTAIGGYDLAVSEFVRVSGTLLPRRMFERICPEILAGSPQFAAGTPVAVQLLGSDPVLLAENARAWPRWSPHGIDLNFGCPAKVVNRHGGGAMLLDRPRLLHDIAAAVRAAVPAAIPVSAKMRLGIADPSRALDCAQAPTDGARRPSSSMRAPASRATARPRTGSGGAHRRRGARAGDRQRRGVERARLGTRCREVSAAEDVMIGRGAVSDPGSRRIRGERHRAGRARLGRTAPAPPALLGGRAGRAARCMPAAGSSCGWACCGTTTRGGPAARGGAPSSTLRA